MSHENQYQYFYRNPYFKDYFEYTVDETKVKHKRLIYKPKVVFFQNSTPNRRVDMPKKILDNLTIIQVTY